MSFIFLAIIGVSFSTSAYADGDDVFGTILGTLGAITIINGLANNPTPVYVQPQPYYVPPPVYVQQPVYQPYQPYYQQPYYQPYYNPPVVIYHRDDDEERYDR